MASDTQRARIEALTRDLERLNTTPNPAQSSSVAGTWRVRYSTAPPPSNGQLGPLFGEALQSINLDTGVYANELLIGSPQKPWINAKLIADWDDMDDGIAWKVNFRKITLSFFGLDVFTKTFDEGTSRIWMTTYLDEDMRIVRAGPTESEAKRLGVSADEDNYFVFVMTREDQSRTVSPSRKPGFFDVISDPARFMEDPD
eukprot:gnl/MRDRNA2_/MRDRNA2_256074_c0_seq1.p1 gnl/MRDRNA2_/MRDRNA2_256074_c0~~gnl/MRDRNA2_/MRDRNA2_256074_c0_seq1.p1  ORF type:complete len:231 (-),score=31.94 gnl/MRDRNA2_/MRDRNA2_256074_c0_seq1:8-607(-)